MTPSPIPTTTPSIEKTSLYWETEPRLSYTETQETDKKPQTNTKSKPLRRLIVKVGVAKLKDFAKRYGFLCGLHEEYGSKSNTLCLSSKIT